MPNQGWAVSKVIAQVNGRTENRAANKPNFDIAMEFFLGLDEFCGEKHYWWRRKAASFSTVANQQQYDLSLTPPVGAGTTDLEEVEEAFIVAGAPFPYPRRVNPSFTPRVQLAAFFGSNSVQQQIPHAAFFTMPFQMWEFTFPPPTIYTIAFTYWAIPMITDTGSNINKPVPLVPPFLHWGMVPMLERRVLSYLFGQNDPRYQVADANYEAFKFQAAKSKQYSSQEAKHSSMQGGSVHSSGGKGYTRGNFWGNQ